MDKILIVDDNALNMKLASDLLEYHGYKVIKACNGKEALAILQNELPSLILLDIILPDIDGLEIFRRIKSNEKYSSIKIAAFTAASANKEKVEMLNFDDFIYKPIDTRDIRPAYQSSSYEIRKLPTLSNKSLKLLSIA